MLVVVTQRVFWMTKQIVFNVFVSKNIFWAHNETDDEPWFSIELQVLRLFIIIIRFV